MTKTAGDTDQAHFVAMLDAIHTGYEVVPRDEYVENYRYTTYVPEEGVVTIIRVLPGYRAHFEAAFDKNGDLLSIGQFEEM